LNNSVSGLIQTEKSHFDKKNRLEALPLGNPVNVLVSSEQSRIEE